MIFQDAATTGNGTVRNLDGQGASWTFYTTWSALVSAGEVTLETAPFGKYAGTWETLAVIPADAGKTITTFVEKPLKSVRARISTTVVDGTVSVEGEGGQ